MYISSLLHTALRLLYFICLCIYFYLNPHLTRLFSFRSMFSYSRETWNVCSLGLGVSISPFIWNSSMLVQRALIQKTGGSSEEMGQLNKSMWNCRFVKALGAAQFVEWGRGEDEGLYKENKNCMFYLRRKMKSRNSFQRYKATDLLWVIREAC